MKLSLIIACYNEEDNIEVLTRKAEAALSSISSIDEYEIIYVDDGSTDKTLDRLLACKGKKDKIYTYKKNHGQSAAMLVGIQKAKFEFLGFMDGDLQNDPNDFSELIAVLTEGYDMVCGVRKKRKDGFKKVISTTLARKIRQILIGDNYFDITCPLKVLKRETLTGLTFYNTFHRFIPVLVEMQGYKVAEVCVNHYPRVAGKSKYGIRNRILVGIKSAIAIRWMVKNYLNINAECVEEK